MSKLRLRDSVETLATVWQRAFLDAILAPRRFKRAMSEFRRASDMLFHTGIASLQPSQIPATDKPIQMLSVDSGYGSMPPQDLYALLRVVRWIDPKRIFEIGTFNGDSTAHLVLNSDAEIYTLDLPRESAGDLHRYSPRDAALLQPRAEIGKAYRQFDPNGRIRQLFGDSRTFGYRPYCRSMDLVIVDACHLFDYVMSDSRKAFEMLAEGGAILWHDFGNSLDVTRACKLLAKREPIFHLEGTWLALYVRGDSLTTVLGERGST